MATTIKITGPEVEELFTLVNNAGKRVVNPKRKARLARLQHKFYMALPTRKTNK